MDTAISALILSLLGLGLALFAIVIGLRTALHPSKKRPPITDGLYRLKQVGKDGLDSIFEIEEVGDETKPAVRKPGSQKAPSERKAP